MDKYRQTIEMHLTKTKIYLEQIEKQKKQIKELQDENVELTSKALSNAREMNPQTFTDDYTAKLEQQLQESKESYVNLYEENVHNVQEMQQLNTKIQDQYNKIVQFTEVLQKAEDKYIQLQQERDYYKKFRDSSITENEKLQSKIEELKQTKNLLIKEHTRLKTELEQSKSNEYRITEECDGLLKQYNELKIAYDEERRKREDSEIEFDKLSAELEDVRKEWNMNNEALRVLRFKSDNQEKEKKKLENEKNNLKEENDQLQVEINRIELSEKSLKNSMECKEKQYEREKIELETKMEQEYKRMEDNYLDVIKELREKMEGKMDNDKDKLHQELSIRMNDIVVQWDNNRNVYQKKYDEKDKEYRTLKRQLDSITRKAEALEKDNKISEDQKYNLKKQIDSLKEENRLLKNQYNELKLSIDKANAIIVDKDNVENNYKILRHDYDLLLHKMDSLNRMKMENEKDLNNKLEKCNELNKIYQAKNNDLIKNMSLMQRQLNDLKKENMLNQIKTDIMGLNKETFNDENVLDNSSESL